MAQLTPFSREPAELLHNRTPILESAQRHDGRPAMIEDEDMRVRGNDLPDQLIGQVLDTSLRPEDEMVIPL
jgi:hypothetical protein